MTPTINDGSYSNIVSITYQDPDRVFIERNADETGWDVIDAVIEPDIEVPADYTDENGFQVGVEYCYRIRRYEDGIFWDYSNTDCVVYQEVVGAVTVKSPCAEVEYDGFAVIATGTEFATVSAELGYVGVEGLDPTTSALKTVHVTDIPPPNNEFEGIAPAITISFSTIILSVFSEFEIEGLSPNIQTVKNPTVNATLAVIDVDSIAPVVEGQIGAPVLTASQPDGYIYVEWEVLHSE